MSSVLFANCRLYWRWDWRSCWRLFKRFLLKLMDPFFGNILYLSTLLLTVCELQTLLKMRLKELLMSLLSLFLILLQIILVKIFLSVAFIFQWLFFFSNLLSVLTDQTLWRATKFKDMEALLTWIFWSHCDFLKEEETWITSTDKCSHRFWH